MEKEDSGKDIGMGSTKKYYAVAKGKTPGIYFTWDDCKNQVYQFPGAVYKGFSTIAEAEEFIRNAGVEEFVKEQPQQLELALELEEDTPKEISREGSHLVAYVDGSYDHSQLRYAYGCVFVFEDEVITLNGSDCDEDYVSMRNVAGEILGSEHAISWAIEHGYQQISIYYDYEGIEKWANGLWKANKPGTQRYKEFVAKKRNDIEISFYKVEAHTGVTYNEMADRLAKEALGLEV